MGGVRLQLLCLVLKVCVFSLVLQGSAGFSLSPSPSASSSIPPIEEGIPSSVSHGKAFRSNAPAPAFELNGTSSPPANVLPPLTSNPVPQPKEALTPSLQPSAPTLLPPPSSAPPAISSAPPPAASLPALPPPPIKWNGPAPVLPPSAPKRERQHAEQPVSVPEAPAPVSSPGRNSPEDAPTKAPPLPGSKPPSESRAPESPLSSIAPAPRGKPHNSLPTIPRNPEVSPSIPPVLNAPAPRGNPENPLPTHPIIPEVSPSVPPVLNAPSPRGKPQKPLPVRPNNPEVSPSIPPAIVAPPPRKLPNNSPPSHPRIPLKPPSSSPGKHEISPVSTLWPSIHHKRASAPAAAPPNGIISQHPAKAPTEHKAMGSSTNAPHKFFNSPPKERLYPPLSAPSTSFQRDHRLKDNMTAITPSSYEVHPHLSTEQGPLIPPSPSFHTKSYPKTNLRHQSHSPLTAGSSVPPLLAPLTSPESHDSPAIAPSPAASSRPTKKPFLSPPLGSSSRHPKIPHPFQALPPPPPNEDCASLACAEPFTNGPPKTPCVCVLPMRVGLRLSVALYTFFPLVSELATEIAVGVFIDPSQVRIMGANSASQYPEKTIVLIDLVPLGEKFDNTTAFLTSQRFWHKQVLIKASLFGDYDVLYVQYPGLPPSPPSAASDIDTIGSRPYPGDNNGRTIQPLGVDVSGQRHKSGPNRSVIAVIVLSASVAVILCCAVAWVLLFRHRDRGCQSDPTPPTTLPSLAKSSGIAASMIGSRPNSPSLSFSSSFAAYTGSARTFSSSEIERATDNFNEARVLGEGGFGRVYSGVLDDGTKVAVKILKRDDQQGGREFLAEVEMLSRLHHRNLVKLIGICIEERSRCLVYELMPNGSVESHLHGVDKEISPLDWHARMKIALGAARGLAYLHEDSSPRVIHRDFKSSNILLEHDFTPKVSDFGLARAALDEENRHISTRVMGTFGYVAPEYAMTGHLLVKSDVYSYGVVLLELLTGRKPVDMSQPPGQENLVAWARPLLTSEDGLELIVDSTLGPDFPSDDIVKVAAIASMCVQPEVSHRPFMGEVVQALKLVCSEGEQTKEFVSRSCSRDDLSIDMDARMSTASGQLLMNPRSPVSNSDSELDVERGLSMSDLLSPLARFGKKDSSPFRRYSSSGPFRTGKTRRLWQKMRRLSAGSVSEHGMMFGLQCGSH
uniref:Receptor-like serine/threonine-protein kinase ALE2 isoform X3 n=1 Tax=Nicotiana tabacum TaxID=4097 RepID=A0A1S4BPE7_TOBAC|nr:PREDICTED: receptor-like serine/threonine-protein kinase ALE2 isoform X3 [Nicotiana tabacum]